MNKASSAFLATAGVTVGLLGFALPAGASVSDQTPPAKTCTFSAPHSNTKGSTDDVTFQGVDGKGHKGCDGDGKGCDSDLKGYNNGSNGYKNGDGQGYKNGDGQGYKNGDGKDGKDGTWGNRDGKPDPCPAKTETPCPPKPCQVVETKPCKPHKDKYGHLQTYTTAKHVYVCQPKPCPTKAKPCPPKCKKTQPHRHAPCKPQHKQHGKG